jgi:hypothetical protein
LSAICKAFTPAAAHEAIRGVPRLDCSTRALRLGHLTSVVGIAGGSARRQFTRSAFPRPAGLSGLQTTRKTTVRATFATSSPATGCPCTAVAVSAAGCVGLF